MSQPPQPPAHPLRVRCPICGRPSEPEFRPFCSKRCADVDLSRWLGGVYRIEGPENTDPSTGSEDTDEV